MIAYRESSLNNQLLASLPPEVTALLQPRSESVDLAAGTLLFEAGSVLRHVYFPVTAVVSLVSGLQDGASAEVAVVGREGMVGVSAFMGGGTAHSSAVVQRAGLAWRMSARDIADLARDAEPLMQQLLRYTQALITHMAQTSACHRHHALGPQLCRWLLQHLDRQVGDELRVTQERIAAMLGVRREGVTAAALQLQREGSIRYSRGLIRVLSRPGLQRRCCECHGVVQLAYERLRNGSSAWPQPANAHNGGVPQGSAQPFFEHKARAAVTSGAVMRPSPVMLALSQGPGSTAPCAPLPAQPNRRGVACAGV